MNAMTATVSLVMVVRFALLTDLTAHALAGRPDAAFAEMHPLTVLRRAMMATRRQEMVAVLCVRLKTIGHAPFHRHPFANVVAMA